MKSRLYSFVLMLSLAWSFVCGCICIRAIDLTGANLAVYGGLLFLMFVTPTFFLTEFVLDRVIRMEFGDYD